MTKTKVSSLEALSNALRQHGWQFTVEQGEVTVKDPTVDLAPRWSQRRVFGTKQVPGVIVRFANGVEPVGHSDYGSKISGVAKFTENGALVEVSGGYPLNGGATLAHALAVVAEKSRFEVERLRAVRAEQREQSAAEDIVKADNKVAEAREAALEARPAAVLALVNLTGLTGMECEKILDALASEVGQPINVFVGRDWEVRRAEERAQYARDQYLASEQRGWVW